MKKSALKNRIKSYWGKHKTRVFVVILSMQLAIGLTIYFLFGRISPNDEIFVPKEDSVAFLVNQNPKFSVDFGNVEQPDKQVVRFEALTSNKNPFEEEKGNIFTKIVKFFQKKERYGIEMSLVGVDLTGEDLEKYGSKVIQVADVIGTDSIKTTTELIDAGREIGEYGDQETPISKQTVLNKEVTNGVDLEYQIMKGLGLKEEIVIRDLEKYKDSCKEKGCSLPVNEFVFDLKMDSGIELKEGWFTIDGQSTSTYYFVDSKGRYVAHFLPNFAIDNVNNKTFDVDLKVEKGGGDNYRVKVTVDLDWLLSGARVFPVRIDPSIVHDDTADFSGGIFNGIESVTGPKIQIVEGGFDCSGGTETTTNGYKMHVFTSSSSLVCSGSSNVQLLVVAGGGGGGNAGGGGGGAGGVVLDTAFSVNTGTITVTVGNGGAAHTNGQNSVFSTITAIGGGRGGTYNGVGTRENGADGGSGGGGSISYPDTPGVGGAGTAGQGNNGGTGGVSGGPSAAGGGGKNAVGGNGSASGVGGAGGAGIDYSSYFGTSVGASGYFGGGGGGGNWSGSYAGGAGGVGGGGAGINNSGTAGAGTANTGGGGGGAGSGGTGGAGGSGIIIVRYQILPSNSTGEYTSSSMDMGSSMSSATLSWTPSGVNTGDGETPYSTTGLVAQWNFNETSGTTAVSGGSCGTSCNGTLTNMTTSGQDAAAGTGWTANNKRWGAGALMFDGTNDYFSLASITGLSTGNTVNSIETWIKPTAVPTTRQWPLLLGDASAGNVHWTYNTNGRMYLGPWSGIQCSVEPVVGAWNQVVFTFDGTTVSCYLNGSFVGSGSSTLNLSSTALKIGQAQAGEAYFNGSIDSTRIYSRALSADEILSNYQAGNIEFQYRISTNNSTWSSWTSYNDGALMLDGTNDYISIPDNNNLDITSSISLEAWINLNNVTATYQAIVGKRDASATEANYALRAGTNQLTFYYYANGSYQTYTTSNASLVANTWYHVVATFDGSTVNIYKNGTLLSGSCTLGTCNVAMVADNNSVGIGRPGDFASQYFSGIIDSVRIYSRVLNSTEVSANYAMADGESPSSTTSLVGYWKLNESSGTSAVNLGTCGTSCDGTLTNISDTSGRDVSTNSGWTSKTKRGSDSLWETFDNPYLYSTSDTGLVGYWPMDEASGSGAFILDKVGGYSAFATGGTLTVSGGYRIHTFTSSGTLVVNGSENVEVLVVAGGGGGANGGLTGNGGGGAGGLVYNSSFAVSAGSISVTVGNGGAAMTNGGNSVFSTITAYGGGAGGYNSNGASGGCGGGGGAWNGTAYGASGTQGYGGGDAVSGGVAYGGGGGGGMGARGVNVWESDSWHGGAGGNGLAYSISGTSTYYSGGGGGASRSSISVSGGLGGGGNGGGNGVAPTAGTANTGGGGGAGYSVGMAGGSGIVIVRYPSTYSGSLVYSNGTPTNTTYVGGKSTGARSFNGSSSYIDLENSSVFDVSNLTIEAWVYSEDFNHNGHIFEKGPVNTQYSAFFASGDTFYFRTYNSAGTIDSLTFTTSTYFNNKAWNHVVCTYDGSNKKVYVNGVLAATKAYTETLKVGQTGQRIGAYGGATPSYFFNGIIDEVRVFSTALSEATIVSDYTRGIMNKSSAVSQKGGSIKMEGSGSLQVTSGANVVDSNTVALWHLDERGGSSAYLKDLSANAYNATPSGTTYTKGGKSGGARILNGTSDYIDAPDIDTLGYFTYEAWVKLANIGKTQMIFDKELAGSLWPSVYMTVNSGNTVTFGFYKASSTVQSVTSIATLSAGTYYHLAGTYNGSNLKIYINGVLNNTAAATGTPNDITNNLTIGGQEWNASPYYRNLFDGTIDEIRISNISRNATEVANSYKLGKDTYVNKVLDVKDLSVLSTLPIYIASDRPGAYLNTTWGETGYSNYQPDANTVGLWHLDEASGTGAYVLNSTGGGGHGTPTGTTFTTAGKIGGARSFNGTSSDYISTSANYNFGAGAFTISLWVNPTSFANSPIPLSNGIYNTAGFYMQFSTSGAIVFYTSQSGAVQTTSSTASALTNRWQLITVTRSGSSVRIYLNGQDITSSAGTHVNPASTTSVFTLGTYAASPSGYPLSGLLDEVQVSNIARSADEIRQAYEVGLRTHSVNVKFGASLVSGNLITGSGDTSFSIDATVYGLSSLGSEIYPGEKIIVKENYDGTEYIAQGTVATVNESTGAVTVSSWDSGSTFPSAGYTVNADVFKWQREYIPIKNRTVSTHVNAVNLLSFNITDGNEGRNIWIDDLRSSSGYLSDYTGEDLTFSSDGQYFQYKAIFSTWNPAITPYISQVQLDYTSNGPTMDQIMRHGKWFDSSGVKQPFWWVNAP